MPVVGYWGPSVGVVDGAVGQVGWGQTDGEGSGAAVDIPDGGFSAGLLMLVPVFPESVSGVLRDGSVGAGAAVVVGAGATYVVAAGTTGAG